MQQGERIIKPNMNSHSHSQSRQRHLKDLLSEDQEPFLNLCNNRNLQLNKNTKQNASFVSHFRKNACFSCTTTNSPDLFKKSPLISPVAAGKSPSHALFLNVPSKTAALLLDSAMRIHQTNSNSTSKHKSKFHFKNPGFALLGSVIKCLTNRSHTPNLNSLKTGDEVIRWADSVKTEPTVDIRVGSDTGSMETSGFADNQMNNVNFPEEEEGGFVNTTEQVKESSRDGDFTFCLSPLSTFRFALHTNPSPACLSPEYSSPATSPCHRLLQDNVKYEQDPSIKFQLEDDAEKEQNSPVSILESPFGDDEHGSDTECSYAFVQSSKQRLFQKLRKFERLAGLDSTELDTRFRESDNGIDQHYLVDMTGMKRLLSDLISEEERLVDDNQSVVERVCKRMESWKEMESNTIDAMVGMELNGEGDEWKKTREEVSWTGKTLELSIFMILVDELVDDLVCLD